MQAYLNFFDKINKLIEAASYQTKFNLALDVCKKLLPDYESFVKNNKADDAALLHETIDYCENGKDHNPHKTEKLINKITAITPSEDDFSRWDITYASNAANSVLELLRFVNDSKNQHISDICSLMIDTTDFKIAAANEHLSDDAIYKHPHMLVAMKEITDKLLQS